MVAESYTKLDVWHKSMDLVATVYLATQKFPKEELYGLTSQIRRAAVSIPSNIAEGRSRRSTKDFMRFVNIASGSTAEVETQIMIAQKLGFLATEDMQRILTETTHIGRMLNKLHLGLEKKLTPQTEPSQASNL